jgi:hypothetical protein
MDHSLVLRVVILVARVVLTPMMMSMPMVVIKKGRGFVQPARASSKQRQENYTSNEDEAICWARLHGRPFA